MRSLVPACHVGAISALERPKIVEAFRRIFHGPQDRWFIAPICSSCHQRFVDLNQEGFEHIPDFEML